jgi:hypothetical protein
VHRERIHLRRAQGDEPADQVGPAYRQHLREAAATALPDRHGALTLLLDDPPEPLFEPLDSRAATVCVHPHPGAAGAVAGSPQPVGHQRHRRVAGQEAGDQQRRPAAAVGEAFPAQDRVAQEAGGLQSQPSLPP